MGPVPVAVNNCGLADDDPASVVPALDLVLRLTVARASGKLSDRFLIGDVVNEVDQAALGRCPDLDLLEPGQAPRLLVDLSIESVEVVVVGAWLGRYLAGR